MYKNSTAETRCGPIVGTEPPLTPSGPLSHEVAAVVQRAVEFDCAEEAVRETRLHFFDACEVCKLELGIDGYVVNGSDDWERLSEKTVRERIVLQQAKRNRENAKRRLRSAVRRHLEKVAS